MSGGAQRHTGGPAVRTLPASQRRALRAARRRQVRRRQAVALGVLVTIIALVVAGTQGGGRSPLPLPARATAHAAANASVAKSAPTQPHPAASTAGAQAAPVDHVLGYTSYVQLAGHRRKDVALTFDDGPGPYTARVLRVLRAMKAPATFFLIGRSASAYPRLVSAEAAAGEEVGDHTETHPPLGRLSAGVQAAQISQAATAIRQGGAPAPVLMRPPYGSLNAATLQVLHAQRMLMVLWSVDTKDYSRPGVSRIAYTAISGAQPGAIVLMHDGGGDRSETVAALPRIITRLRQRGFRLVTISQLVADDPPPRNQPPPHSLAGF